MEAMIEAIGLSKTFRIARRRPGLLGGLRSVVTPQVRTVEAVQNLNPVIPARIYICLKCAASDPPPPFSVPREGDEAPVCPKRWFHGPMQRKDA